MPCRSNDRLARRLSHAKDTRVLTTLLRLRNWYVRSGYGEYPGDSERWLPVTQGKLALHFPWTWET